MKIDIKHYIILLPVALSMLVNVGCSFKDHDFLSDPDNPRYYARHLIAKGKVTNEQGEPLEGIRVAIYGVREETEQDILSYNYCFTDSTGLYTIVRYAGREILTEVTLVATDTAHIYTEQSIVAPVVYDSVESRYDEKRNAVAEADFVLTKF